MLNGPEGNATTFAEILVTRTPSTTWAGTSSSVSRLWCVDTGRFTVRVRVRIFLASHTSLAWGLGCLPCRRCAVRGRSGSQVLPAHLQRASIRAWESCGSGRFCRSCRCCLCCGLLPLLPPLQRFCSSSRFCLCCGLLPLLPALLPGHSPAIHAYLRLSLGGSGASLHFDPFMYMYISIYTISISLGGSGGLASPTDPRGRRCCCRRRCSCRSRKKRSNTTADHTLHSFAQADSDMWGNGWRGGSSASLILLVRSNVPSPMKIV